MKYNPHTKYFSYEANNYFHRISVVFLSAFFLHLFLSLSILSSRKLTQTFYSVFLRMSFEIRWRQPLPAADQLYRGSIKSWMVWVVSIKHFEIFVHGIDVPSSNLTKDNFTFHPFGADKISVLVESLVGWDTVWYLFKLYLIHHTVWVHWIANIGAECNTLGRTSPLSTNNHSNIEKLIIVTVILFFSITLLSIYASEACMCNSGSGRNNSNYDFIASVSFLLISYWPLHLKQTTWFLE